MNLRAFGEPEGKGLNIMHTRSVNFEISLHKHDLKHFINLAVEGLRDILLRAQPQPPSAYTLVSTTYNYTGSCLTSISNGSN